MRKKFVFLIAVFCGVFVAFTCSALENSLSLKRGEVIACYGDSITQGGSYPSYLQLFLAPAGVRVHNTGVSGDSSQPGVARIDTVLREVNPDRFLYILGLNDTLGFGTPELTAEQRERINTFRISAEASIQKILAAGKRVVLSTPHAYNQYGTTYPKPPILTKDSNGVLALAEIDRQIAAKYELPLIDVGGVMRRIYQEHSKDCSVAPDRLHPSRPIHIVMAAYIAMEMGISGTVGRCVIPAGQMEAVYTPERLPLARLPEYDEARKYYPLDELFNVETLQAVQLPAGTYAVFADDIKLGEFSAETLNAGISLIGLPTPHQLEADALETVRAELEREQCRFAVNLRFRHIMELQKLDYNIPAVRREWMERWVASAKFNARNVKRDSDYFMKNVDGKETEIRENVGRLQLEILRRSVPQSCKIRIKAVK